MPKQRNFFLHLYLIPGDEKASTLSRKRLFAEEQRHGAAAVRHEVESAVLAG